MQRNAKSMAQQAPERNHGTNAATVSQLLEATERLGGYQAISLIASEALRRLGHERRRKEGGIQGELVGSLTEAIKVLGDVETASLLQNAVEIYQKALREGGGEAQARCWADAWMGLGATARKLLRASPATPGGAERKPEP